MSTEQDKIVTDCLGLLNTAKRGIAAASTAKMGLARTWTMIAHHLDGRLDVLAQAKRLTWMPAHQSPAAIGCALRSTGTPITALDWRANHLVDGLAKRAAAIGATTAEESRLVTSAEKLVRHCAGQLAAATYKANNYVECYVDSNGCNKTRSRRDSQDIPKACGKKLKPLAALEPKTTETAPVEVEFTCQGSESSDSEKEASYRTKKRAARAHAKRAQEKLQKAALDDIVHTKRMNHCEASVDTHRRKVLASTLSQSSAPPAQESWGSFLELAAESRTVSQEVLRPPLPTPLPASPRDSSETGTSESQSSKVVVRSVAGGPVQCTTRTRPTKGSSGTTAATTRAAVDSLLGKKITQDHG